MRTVVEDGVEYIKVQMTWDAASADAMKRWNQGDTLDEFFAKVTPDFEETTFDEMRATVLRVLSWPSWLYAPDSLVNDLINQGIITRDEYNASIETLTRNRDR